MMILFHIANLFNDFSFIKTVGKTYMACAGLRSTGSNTTKKVLEMALQIQSYVGNVTWGEGQKITLKIGIHHGNVIAGVIGFHKPQFSLIGDTVNTASRICSTSEEGIITLSEEAYNEVKNIKGDLNFVQREVEAKGKGVLKTFQVRSAHTHRLEGSCLFFIKILFLFCRQKNIEGFLNESRSNKKKYGNACAENKSLRKRNCSEQR